MGTMMTGVLVRRALSWLGRNLTADRMAGVAMVLCRLAGDRPPGNRTTTTTTMDGAAAKAPQNEGRSCR